MSQTAYIAYTNFMLSLSSMFRGGATAIIASVQPAAVNMSWRLIYVVLISALIMTVWACIINVSHFSLSLY